MSNETWLETIKEKENYMVDQMAVEIRESSARIIWNVGVGDGSGLLGFLMRMSEKAVCKLTNFDYVIRISIPSISDTYSSNESNEGIDEIRKKAIMAIADELGIMDEDNTPLINLKAQLEEQTYYTYKVDKEKESKLVQQMKNIIFEKLASKRYLLIVQNMVQSLYDPKNRWLLESVVPLPVMVSKSYWMISTTSMDVYNRSREETFFLTHHIFKLSDLIRTNIFYSSVIIELELFHVAKSISTDAPRKLMRTIDVLWNCLLYSQLFSTEDEESRERESCPYYIQQKELVKFWISEGIFSQMAKLKHPKTLMIEEFAGALVADEEEDYPNPNSLGEEETILRVLLSHSLLCNISSSLSYPISSSDAFVVPFSGMWELLSEWKNDIRLYGDVEKNSWLRNRWALIKPNSYKKWANKNWISFFNDTGRCIIHPKPNPTTTFVLRGCTDISKLSLEKLFPQMKKLCVLDLSYTSIKLLPQSLSEMTDLRLLSLRGCSLLRTLVPHSSSNSALSPLGPLQHLEVLDFREVPLDMIPDDVGNFKYELRYFDLSSPTITSLPSNLFEHMSSLREISFLGCAKLGSLPHSLTDLLNLEMFSLSESQIVYFPNETFERMSKLRTLNLTNNQSLRSLPTLTGHVSLKSLTLSESLITHLSLNACRSLETVCLHDLEQLEELDLSATAIKALDLKNNTSLRSLPTLAGHANIKSLTLSRSPITRLSLHACRSLETVCLHSLDQLEELDLSATAIKVLNLKNNKLLRSLPTLAGYVSLKSLTLSGSPMTRLSLHACRSLETVCLHGLDQLEELDLSATAIKELPIEVLELRRLRRLDLLEVPQLRRVPWHKLDRLPEVFNLDQCKYGVVGNPGIIVQSNIAESSQLLKGGVGARIFLTDSRLFSSFTYKDCKHLVEGGSLRSFYISVSSCKGKEKSKKGNELTHPDQFHKKQPSRYKDVPLIGSTFKQQFDQSPLNRHVEISYAERYPTGLNGILQIVESLSVRDDAFVSSLTDLNGEFPYLQECKLRKLSLMEAIFRATDFVQGEKLRTLWVSDLVNMTEVMIGSNFVSSEFKALKHVHIQHCPRLESIFPSDMWLECLETITVLHCGNLKAVFYGMEIHNENQYRKLHTIQLHELPQLLHLCEKQHTSLQMPKLKDIHIRGCLNLRRLPLLVGPRDQKVHVDGETRKYKKLKDGMDIDQLSCYDFKFPPPSTSFREGVKDRIFLR